MKRVFILVPDLNETSDIAKEFKASGVHEEDIHVCAHINQELEGANLQPANIFQMTNLGYAIKLGPVIGLLFVGLIIALCYFVFPLHISTLGYVAIFVFGIGFGMWASGLIGLGVKNPVVEKYENYVSEGHYLMLVDLKPEKQVLTRQILAHHPRSRLAEQPIH